MRKGGVGAGEQKGTKAELWLKETFCRQKEKKNKTRQEERRGTRGLFENTRLRRRGCGPEIWAAYKNWTEVSSQVNREHPKCSVSKDAVCIEVQMHLCHSQPPLLLIILGGIQLAVLDPWEVCRGVLTCILTVYTVYLNP